jgi:hypothetical protein
VPAENTVLMEGVRIIFRNFEGKEGRYNKAGSRNFGVLVDPATAEAMLADGWNIKYLQPREDEEEETEPQPWLPVEAAFDRGRPPRVVLITSRGRTNLSEDEVEMLDWADITNVDLIVRPYTWEVNGKTGTKAYLQSMYVTIEEDELERKYAELDQQ